MNENEKKIILEKIIKRSNKTTIQTLVRNFNIERLGYLYADIVEDAYNVKKGTSSFGAAVTDLFLEYKVDNIRLSELDQIIRTSHASYRLHYSIDVKREQMKIHNKAVEEFKEKHKSLSSFVKLANKILKK